MSLWCLFLGCSLNTKYKRSKTYISISYAQPIIDQHNIVHLASPRWRKSLGTQENWGLSIGDNGLKYSEKINEFLSLYDLHWHVQYKVTNSSWNGKKITLFVYASFSKLAVLHIYQWWNFVFQIFCHQMYLSVWFCLVLFCFRCLLHSLRYWAIIIY